MISAGLALALQLFWHSDAVAQRTAEGSTFLGVSPTVSVYAVPSGGLDICAGGYMRSSLWKAGVRAIDWNHRIASDTGVGHDDLFDHIAWSLYGGWRYRLFGTYNRVLSVYGGGDVFLGCLPFFCGFMLVLYLARPAGAVSPSGHGKYKNKYFKIIIKILFN